MNIREKIKELGEKKRYTFDDLRDIMVVLRSEDGCPWDREQNHKSIRQNMLEEAYEAAEAIDLSDDGLLCEELGDVMLQVVFHSRIAEETGSFTLDDVCHGVCSKLVERHPHVFGKVSVSTSDEVLANWDNIKQKSKNRSTLKEQLDGVCRALPSLMLAEKFIGKALKNNIDIGDCRIKEGTNEEQIGEMLFDIAKYAKKHGIDTELALSKKCNEFAENISKTAE